MFAPALQFGNTVESRNFVYIALSIRDYFKASSIKHSSFRITTLISIIKQLFTVFMFLLEDDLNGLNRKI